MHVVRFSAVLVVGAVLLVTAGCATITREECRAEDWATIGQRDGAEGHAPSRLESHARTCSNFDIVPDPVAYQQGWDEGVLLWCTPENGFRTGRDDRGYHGLCPAAVTGPFLEGRGIGQRLGVAERRLSSAENAVRSAERRREDLRDRMERIRADRTITAEARRDALDEIRDELDDIRWDRDRLESDLRRARADIVPIEAEASAFFERIGRSR